mmetsp:Transcript_116145/g.375287  ORF Transcript_116145/g.375287 Transcript_116145/m.375287 type:complete len:279 (+) Transcript_116145:64-900(+)
MSRFVGFLKGADQYGRWVPEAEITARGVMGAATIDFSQALFTHSVIKIYTKAFWGGVTIIVPPGVSVEQDGRAIMGGFGTSGGLYHSDAGGRLPETTTEAAITIKVEGTAIMGAIKAAVNQRAAPAQLISAQEAARILREVPEAPSTTRSDMLQQALGDAAAALHLRGQCAQAAAVEQAMAARGFAQQPPPSAVVQGIPVPSAPIPSVAAASVAPQAANNCTGASKEGAEPAAPAAPGQPPATDWKQELRELKELLDTGVLTEEEFAAQKAKVLARAG